MANITANDTKRSFLGTAMHRVGDAVKEVFVEIAQRRTLRELAALDDHQLADIGLQRDQLNTRLFASELHTVDR